MDRYGFLLNHLSNIIDGKNILINEPMKKHTSMKTGGCADVMIIPANKAQLLSAIGLINKYDFNYYVMGNGTNLIVRDKGIRGIVIKTGYVNKINIHGNIIESEAGALLSKIANIALKNGLGGMEFASGIPGTIGGAVAMNAGAYDREIKDIVIKTEYINRNGEILTVRGDEHQFGYRTSIFQKRGDIVLSTLIELKQAEKNDIMNIMTDFNNKRKQKQPLDMPSAGSIFKRPVGYYAGKLIEDCGLKGYSIGGAVISGKHCGFIVNNGNATTQDVIKLIEYVQDTVMKKYGIRLETEVKIIGEE